MRPLKPTIKAKYDDIKYLSLLVFKKYLITTKIDNCRQLVFVIIVIGIRVNPGIRKVYK